MPSNPPQIKCGLGEPDPQGCPDATKPQSMNGFANHSPVRGFHQFVKRPILRPNNSSSKQPEEQRTDDDEGVDNGTNMAPTSDPEVDMTDKTPAAGSKRNHEESKNGEDPKQVSPDHEQASRGKEKDQSMETEAPPAQEGANAEGDTQGAGAAQHGSSTPKPRRNGGRNAFQVLKKAQQEKAQATKAAKAAAASTEDAEMGENGDEDADMAEEDTSYSKVASRKAPALDLALFQFKVLLYITFRVFKNSKMSTGDNIRNRTCQVLDLIIENFTDCFGEAHSIVFLPLKRMDHSQVLQRGSQLPKQFRNIKKFICFINDTEDFTKNFGGDYGREFRIVARVATKEEFAAVMDDNILDLALAGVKIEVKRLQVVHSTSDLVMLHVPRDLELRYVQEEFPLCLKEALAAHYQDPSLDLSVIQRNCGAAQPEIKHRIEWNFAPNSYNPNRWGQNNSGRSKTPAANKKVFQVEFDTTRRDDLVAIVQSGHLKAVMRKHGLGRLAHCLISPPEDAPRKSIDKYRSLLDGHAAANNCLSRLTITGVSDMTTPVEIEVGEEWQLDETSGEMVPTSTSTITLSLRDLLLGLTIEISEGVERPLIDSLGQDANNDWDILFPGDARRRAQVEKMAVHLASWVMYYLAIEKNATEQGSEDFLTVGFRDLHVRLAMNSSSWDPVEEAVSLDADVEFDLEQGDEEMEELKAAAAEWIDMSTLDPEEKGIQDAADGAGVMFAHDEAVDASSLNTQQYFENRAQAGLRRGIRGLRKKSSQNGTSPGGRKESPTAPQRPAAATDPRSTASHTSKDVPADGPEDPQSKGHGSREPPADKRSGAGNE